MAEIRDVVFDSRHPASVARFWALVLEGYAVAPYDQAELDRLTGMGARVLARQEEWVTMADPEGNEFDVMPG